MSFHYSAQQYEDSFRPRRLRNWQLGTNPWPGEYACPRRCPTQFIADDNGHLLPCVPRNPCSSPWGDFRTSIWETKYPCCCMDMIRNPTDYMRSKRYIFVTRETCFPHAEARRVKEAFTSPIPPRKKCDRNN